MVNGIDYSEWHPAVDSHLQLDGYTNYDLDTVGLGKAVCKAALQAVSQCLPLVSESFHSLTGQGSVQGGAAGCRPVLAFCLESCQ